MKNIGFEGWLFLQRWRAGRAVIECMVENGGEQREDRSPSPHHHHPVSIHIYLFNPDFQLLISQFETY